MKRIGLIALALMVMVGALAVPASADEPVVVDEINDPCDLPDLTPYLLNKYQCIDPDANAADSDQTEETTVSDKAATEQSTDDSITDMQGGTDKCVDTDGCDTDEPICVEDCDEPPVCTENCGGITSCEATNSCVPDPPKCGDEPCIDRPYCPAEGLKNAQEVANATGEPVDVQFYSSVGTPVDIVIDGEDDSDCGGGGPVSPGIVGPGTNLPFTGIADFMIPIAFGLLLLLTGAMLYQYASLQDALGALRQNPMAKRVRSGFGEALDKIKK